MTTNEPASTTNRRKALLVGISRSVVLLAFTSLFADISSEMLYPILPVFLTEVLHAPTTVVGLIEGIGGACQYGIQGFSGWLGDRLGRQKRLAAVGYAVSAVGKPVIGVATGWPMALGGRMLDRLGAGSRSAPRDALIAGATSEAHRGKAFGLEGIGDNAGAFVGPLVALLLVSGLNTPLRAVFLLAFIPGVLALLMLLFVQEPPTPRPENAPVRFTPAVFPAAYWRYLLVTALFGIGDSTNAFLILRVKGLGASFATTVIIYAGFNLVAALVSYPAGSLADVLGRKRLLLLAFGIFAVAYGGFAASTSVALLALLFLLYGVHQGIYRGVGKAQAVDLTPVAFRTSGVGWYGTTVGLTGLVASVIGGWLWSTVTPTATFLYGAVFALIGAGALVVLVAEPKP
jgi:MFS family permease